jgi:hypothetical protein
MQLWLNKRGFYDSGWDVCAAVSLFPRVETIYFVADPSVIKVSDFFALLIDTLILNPYTEESSFFTGFIPKANRAI